MAGQTYDASRRRVSATGRSELEAAREKAIDVIGKFWAAPNSLLGIGACLAGHVIGKIQGRDPRISVGNNAIQFEDNPVGGATAMARDGSWHGSHNWNEVGPQMSPSRP